MNLIIFPTILIAFMRPYTRAESIIPSYDQAATKRNIRGTQEIGNRIIQLDVADAISFAVADINEIIKNQTTIAPTFVRLGFHDCVGGCDGCVDLGNPDNAGLEVAINALSSVVNNSKYTEAGLSRADLWALAAITGANYAKPDTSYFFESAYYGRTNCEDIGLPCLDANSNEVSCTATTGPHRDLPSANLDTEDVLDFFNDNFGFTDDETVALMGAHSIGRALRTNSGFDGSNGWVNHENTLNNEYYKLIVGDEYDLYDAPNWQQKKVKNHGQVSDRFEWELGSEKDKDGQHIFMLNSDIALVRTFGEHLNRETGHVSCEFKNDNDCNEAFTINQVGLYRDNNDLWLHDFRSVFEKMLIQGYSIGCEAVNCLLEVIGYDPIEENDYVGESEYNPIEEYDYTDERGNGVSTSENEDESLDEE